MPVEIRELIIRAVTTFNPEAEPETAAQTNLARGEISPLERDEIIHEAVRQVLQILDRAKER